MTTADVSLRYLLMNEMKAIQKEGYQVVGLSAPGPNVASLEEEGIPHVPVPLTRKLRSPISDLKAIFLMWRFFSRHGITIVHTHTPKAGLLGQIAARLASVPIVINTVHGFYFHDRSSRSRRAFYMTLERIAARLSSKILSQNREDLTLALKERIGDPNKWSFLGNGVDTSAFDPSKLDPHDVATARKELGLTGGERVIGFVGRPVEEKGLLDLFRAAQALRIHEPSLRILIVGSEQSSKKGTLETQIRQNLGVEDICIFTGQRNDLPVLYSLMDVFVLPSYREGLPRAPMEAALMELPCVVTDVRGCRDVVVQEQTGFIVPPHDPGALAKRLGQLLTDEGLRNSLGRAGRKFALENFDEREVFRKVLTAYSEALRGCGLETPRPRPDPAPR